MSTNAQLTGPDTDAAFASFSSDKVEQFNELMDRVTVDMRPTSEHEGFLVALIVQARWKLGRLQQVELDLLERTVAGEPVSAQLAAIARLYAAAERSYHAAQRAFAQSRREGLKQSAANFDQAVKAFIDPPVVRLPPTPAASPEQLASFRKLEKVAASALADLALKP